MLRILLILLISIFITSCANNGSNEDGFWKRQAGRSGYSINGKHYQVLRSSRHYEAQGVASWYGRGFNKKRTSSGERYNMYQMTAAHKTLPLASRVQVTNLANGKKVIVRINDRGPFASNRIIDLSYAAARRLGMVGRGTIPVSVKALS